MTSYSVSFSFQSDQAAAAAPKTPPVAAMQMMPHPPNRPTTIRMVDVDEALMLVPPKPKIPAANDDDDDDVIGSSSLLLDLTTRKCRPATSTALRLVPQGKRRSSGNSNRNGCDLLFSQAQQRHQDFSTPRRFTHVLLLPSSNGGNGSNGSRRSLEKFEDLVRTAPRCPDSFGADTGPSLPPLTKNTLKARPSLPMKMMKRIKRSDLLPAAAGLQLVSRGDSAGTGTGDVPPPPAAAPDEAAAAFPYPFQTTASIFLPEIPPNEQDRDHDDDCQQHGSFFHPKGDHHHYGRRTGGGRRRILKMRTSSCRPGGVAFATTNCPI